MLRSDTSSWLAPAALAILVLGGSVWFAAAPPAAGPVAALYPPWWPAAAIIQAAAPAGAIVRFGGAPFILIVVPAPGGRSLLNKSGAWALINPAVLGACGVSTGED